MSSNWPGLMQSLWNLQGSSTDHETRLQYLEANAGGGGAGKQYATFVVAANDSTANGKANADYVCDGTADQVEINLALAASTSSTYRKVLLLEGTFHVTAGIDIVASYTTLEGQGPATRLRIPDGDNSSMSMVYGWSGLTGLRLANLLIDGNEPNQTGGSVEGTFLYQCTNSIIEAVWYLDCRWSAGIWCNESTEIQIVNCHVDNCYDGIYLSGVGGSTTMVVGNTVENCENEGIGLGSASNPYTYSVVANNIVKSCGWGVEVDEGDYLLFANNLVQDITEDGISVGANCNHVSVLGNLVKDAGYSGIYVVASDYVVVKSNTVLYSGTEGIRMSYGDYCDVKHNTVIGSSQTTNDSKANIEIYANAGTPADHYAVQFNTCRQGELANKPKYGIHIAHANVQDALVTNNDVRDGYVTAGIQDSGTNTVLRDNDT